MAGSRIYFITGTDTGVGKTVLAGLLVRHLRAGGVRARAVKPFCSGSRADARQLQRAQNDALGLDTINPWFFRAPLTPLLAARREGRRVRQPQVVAYLREASAGCEALLVEGAGGLLSPLGEGFSARELIVALRAISLVVCPNRLGAINQVLLALAALPARAARVARIVLMSPPRLDTAGRTNPALLAELLSPERVFVLPWLDANQRSGCSPASARVRRVLAGVEGVEKAGR